jgi:hypothetical protein
MHGSRASPALPRRLPLVSFHFFPCHTVVADVHMCFLHVFHKSVFTGPEFLLSGVPIALCAFKCLVGLFACSRRHNFDDQLLFFCLPFRSADICIHVLPKYTCVTEIVRMLMRNMRTRECTSSGATLLAYSSHGIGTVNHLRAAPCACLLSVGQHRRHRFNTGRQYRGMAMGLNACVCCDRTYSPAKLTACCC